MADGRLIDIETKIAHQEHTIAELNDALASQQKQISILEVLLRTLTDRVRSISEATISVCPSLIFNSNIIPGSWP